MTHKPEKGRLLLDLSRRCIEAAAVHEYRRLLNAAIASTQPDTERDQKISTLKAFLEQTDFRALRARQPELAGQTPIRVELHSDQPDGSVSWRIVDRG